MYKISGFSKEGGTRRLIAGYFGIYSRLLCVFFFSFLCFVLQVCLSCFPITLPSLGRLWSKQNRETCLPVWTRSMNAILLDSRASWWNMVTSSYVPKWRPSVSTLPWWTLEISTRVIYIRGQEVSEIFITFFSLLNLILGVVRRGVRRGSPRTGP